MSESTTYPEINQSTATPDEASKKGVFGVTDENEADQSENSGILELREVPKPQKTQPPPKDEPKIRDLPPDFAIRFGTKIITVIERQTSSAHAAEKIWDLLGKHINTPQMYEQLFETMNFLLEKSRTEEFVYFIWRTIADYYTRETEGEAYFKKIIAHMVNRHRDDTIPSYVNADNTSRHSMMAHRLGECFLQVLRKEPARFRTIATIYNAIVDFELADLDLAKEREKKKSTLLMPRDQIDKDLPYFERYFFEDLAAYIMLEENDSLGNTVAGDDMYRKEMIGKLKSVKKSAINRTLQRKKSELDRIRNIEISKQSASPEELMAGGKIFRDALRQYRENIRYNYRYVAMENIRQILRMCSYIVGFVFFMLGYLDILGNGVSGLGVFSLMLIHGYFSYSRSAFKAYYPADHLSQLEHFITQFVPYLRRMSKEQLQELLSKEIYERENYNNFLYISEFSNYLYTIIPNKKNMLCTGADFSDVIQIIEININRKRAHLPPAAMRTD